MRKLLSFIFSLIIVVNCYSQNDWKSGYVIKISGDTVFGLIDNRSSQSNSNYCYFRNDKLSKTTIYEPKDIAGYRYDDGKFFISKNISSTESIKKIFLEFLLEGKINIFHYKDDQNHFFLEKDGQLYELKSTDEIRETNGTKYVLNKKEYLGVLELLMNDAGIQSSINKTRLNSQSLINIAQNYHERVCSGEKCIIYEKKIKPVHVSVGFHIGESINKFNFGDELLSNYNFSNYIGCRLEFENIISYTENLSLLLDFTFQKFSKYNFQNISVTNDFVRISYNGNDYKIFNAIRYSEFDYIKHINVDLKMVALKLPVVLCYTFSKGKIRPYMGLGISNTIVLSQNKDFVYKNFYNVYKKSIPSYSIGYLGRVGCKYILKNSHTIYSDLNIDDSENLNVNQLLRLKNSLYSFTIGYTF